MNRFFGKSGNITDTLIYIDGEDVNHMKNVLRLKVGEEVLVSGGNNREYLCRIREYDTDRAVLEIAEEHEAGRELPVRVHLFQGLPKGDKMELIIQKCVELGVHEIIPVTMKRCVMKLEPKKEAARIARWQAISESAAKQSGRDLIPQIHGLMSMKEALDYAAGMDGGMVPYELAEGMEATKNALSGLKPGQDIAVFIGPEGGFEVSEVEACEAIGLSKVSLGKRILRTETAGFTTMAILMYHMETQMKD